MLELKVRPLTASQIEFLRHWDAEDDGKMRDFLRLNGHSPVYVRKFDCIRCGGGAYECVKASSDYASLWLWSCNCWDVDCRAPRINLVAFTAWTGWKIGRQYLVPLTLKPRTRMIRLDIIVPEELGGEVVWRRGIATFKTIMQAGAASPRDVHRLGRLQILKVLG